MSLSELGSISSTGLDGPSSTDEVGLAGPCGGLAGGLRSTVSTMTAGLLSAGEAGGEAMSSGLFGLASSSSSDYNQHKCSKSACSMATLKTTTAFITVNSHNHQNTVFVLNVD